MDSLIKIFLPIILVTKFTPGNSYCGAILNNYQSDSLKTGWYFAVDSNGYKVQLDKTNRVYQLYPIPFISKKDIESIKVILTRKGIYGLEMDFNSKGTKLWEFATDKSFKENSNLAFVLNGKLVYTAIAKHGKLSDGKATIISVHYSKIEIENMKSILQHQIN